MRKNHLLRRVNMARARAVAPTTNRNASIVPFLLIIGIAVAGAILMGVVL